MSLPRRRPLLPFRWKDAPGLLVNRDSLYKADKEIYSEGAPALLIEVEVAEGGVDLGAITPSSGQRFRMMLLGNEVRIKRTYRFADTAFLFEVRETIYAGGEFVAESREPPCVFEGTAGVDRRSFEDDRVVLY